MGKLWRAETGIFLVSWLYFMAKYGRSGFLYDPGILWHIRVGQLALESMQAPHVDQFSHFYGAPWRPTSGWLSECAMGALYNLAGLDGIVLASATLLAAVGTLVAHRLIRLGFHWSLALLLLVVLDWGCSHHYHARPHLVGWLLFAWMYGRLLDYDAGRIRFAALLWLIPLLALWTNLHGGSIGGLGTLILVVAGWTVAALLGWPAPIQDRRGFWRLALLTLGCFLAMLATPYGWSLLADVYAVSRSPVVARYMIEHKPLPLDGFTGRLTLGLAAVFVGMLVRVALRGTFRVSWLMPLPWLYLALTRARHGPLFMIATAMVLIEMLPYTRFAARQAEAGSWVYRPERAEPAGGGWLAAMLVPALVVLAWLGLEAGGVPGVGRAELDANHWPLDLLEPLQQYEAEHPGRVVFNDMGLGGFLIFYTPRLRVFIDDRCELYDNGFLLDYCEGLSQPERIDGWARQYGFDLALVVQGSKFDQYLAGSADWRQEAAGKRGVIYRRR